MNYKIVTVHCLKLYSEVNQLLLAYTLLINYCIRPFPHSIQVYTYSCLYTLPTYMHIYVCTFISIIKRQYELRSSYCLVIKLYSGDDHLLLAYTQLMIRCIYSPYTWYSAVYTPKCNLI